MQEASHFALKARPTDTRALHSLDIIFFFKPYSLRDRLMCHDVYGIWPFLRAACHQAVCILNVVVDKLLTKKLVVNVAANTLLVKLKTMRAKLYGQFFQ